MCSNFLGMENEATWLKKDTNKKKISQNFILYVTFFQLCYLIFHTQKVAAHCREQNKKRIMTIGWKTKKLFKVKNVLKMSRNFKIISLKIHNADGILKNPNTLLNKGTQYKKIICMV